MKLQLALIGIIASACGGPNKLTLKSGHEYSQKKPLVIAHRGDRTHAPENTISAFSSALAADSDLIELDYHTSRDGIPFVIHDGSLNRTTDVDQHWGSGRHRLKLHDARELKDLDSGSWFSAEFAGERIPTLADSVSFIQENGGKTLIEHKVGAPRVCAELLAAKGYTKAVMVQSFDWEFLTELKRIDDGIETVALGAGPVSEDLLEKLHTMRVSAVSWNYRDIEHGGVQKLKSAGLKVFAFTVNGKENITRVVEAGIDGVITDDPAAAHNILSKIF